MSTDAAKACLLLKQEWEASTETSHSTERCKVTNNSWTCQIFSKLFSQSLAVRLNPLRFRLIAAHYSYPA